VRAAVCAAYGPPEAVKVEELPSPPLGPGQVRIRVAAAAVNYPDVLIVENKYQISVPPPFVPGSEFAGIVAEVAGDVAGVAPGDRVTGTGLVGAFAEEAVVGAAAVRPVPPGLDLGSAAAFGVAYRTAYHVLRSVAALAPGDELVVLGAGGGVGLATVQLGVLLGASVTAVASSPDKLAVATSHGAAHVIDHRTGDLRPALKETLPGGADVVVDPVGGDLAEKALRALRRDGRFVTVGYASGTIPRIPLNLVLLKGITIAGFEFLGWGAHAPDEMSRNDAELDALLASGRVVPHVGAMYPLDEAAAALRLVAEGKAIGKVVIDVNPGVENC
jgi:NADPH2:quinone reductase